jgi:pimeloyl-ACP methyl ester carboxylesterase
LQRNELGDLPLIVLRHGKLEPQMPPEVTELMHETNIRLQAAVAQQSSRGRLVVAEQSGHAIQFDQPALVLQSILEVMEQTRQKA